MLFKYLNEFCNSSDDKTTKISADWTEQASFIWELKFCAFAFTTFLLPFAVTVTLKIIKLPCRWSLFVFVYFYRYLHTHEIPLAVNAINILFLPVLLHHKIALSVAVILVLLNWHTVKTKTHILLYVMQHPRYFLIFSIN